MTSADLARASSRADLPALARGGVVNLLGALCAAVVNVVFVVLVSRAVDREDAGVFFAVTALFLVVATVARLGANTGLVYFLPRLRVTGQPELIAPCLRVALVPVLIISVLLAGGLFSFAPSLSGPLVREAPDATANSLQLLALLLPAAVLTEVALAGTRGLGIVRAHVLVDKIGRPLAQLLLLGLVLLFSAGGPVALAAAWALPYLASALAACLWMSRARSPAAAGVAGDGRRVASPESPVTGRQSAAKLRADFWWFTGPRAVASVAQVVLQRLDVILILALLGPVEAAIYGAVTRFLVVGQLFGQALSMVVQPKLSALLTDARRDEAESVYQASTAWLVLCTWPLFLLIAVFAEQVVQIFGDGYGSGVDVVVLLAVTRLVATSVGLVDTVLEMGGRTMLTLANGLGALALNVALNLLLIPRMGILGAAVAWSAATAVTNIVPLLQVRSVLGLHPFGRATFVAISLSLLLFGALPIAVLLILGDSTGVVFATVLAAGCLYLAALWMCRRQLALDSLSRLFRTRRAGGRGQAGI